MGTDSWWLALHDETPTSLATGSVLGNRSSNSAGMSLPLVWVRKVLPTDNLLRPMPFSCASVELLVNFGTSVLSCESFWCSGASACWGVRDLQLVYVSRPEESFPPSGLMPYSFFVVHANDTQKTYNISETTQHGASASKITRVWQFQGRLP